MEPVGLRKCPYYWYLIDKVTSTDVRTTNISQSVPHQMAENSWYEEITSLSPYVYEFYRKLRNLSSSERIWKIFKFWPSYSYSLNLARFGGHSVVSFWQVFITRRRSFAEYWKHFVARFNDVHASGYNSAGSIRIWMKFGVGLLRVYCPELAPTDFGCDPRRSESRRANGNFFLSGK